jgi:hypothetical protein
MDFHENDMGATFQFCLKMGNRDEHPMPYALLAVAVRSW